MNFTTPREEALWATIRVMPSDQIARVFDRYIEVMLEPVALYTNVVHEGIAEALTLLTSHRRKITKQDPEATVAALFAALSGERESLTATLLALDIERNIFLDMIDTALVDDSVFLPGVEPEPLRRHLRLLLDDLQTFRGLVLNRYIQLITKQSSSFAWGRRQNGLLVEGDEAFQNYFLTAARALDKFNSNNGTVTGYITRWLRNASHSGFTLHLGEAYSITRGFRSKIHRGQVEANNHALPLYGNTRAENATSEPEDPGDGLLREGLQEIVGLLRGVEKIDQYRLVLLSLRADCALSPAEIAQQRATLKGKAHGS